ncbi:MAG: hypothetical protein D6814_13200, partial [Calditrichaeota bacterium]
MSKQNTILHLRIEQDGKVLHRYLNGKSPFYIGKSPKNDITLIGSQFPRRHPLFVPKGGYYVVQLPPMADGEILAKSSKLRFADLIEHELLPRGKGFYHLPIKPGRMGYIFLDSTRIDFVFEKKPVSLVKFPGFSPVRVFFKKLREDALFKGVVTLLLLINISGLYALRDYVPPPKKQAIEQATQRLAKFVIKAPEPPPKKPEPVLATNTPKGAKNEPEKAEPKQPDAKEPVKKEPVQPNKKTVDP